MKPQPPDCKFLIAWLNAYLHHHHHQKITIEPDETGLFWSVFYNDSGHEVLRQELGTAYDLSAAWEKALTARNTLRAAMAITKR